MERDLPYDAPMGPLRFDLYRPDSDEALPAVICIHGGGWISGEKEGLAEVGVALAEEGYAAFCPEYRLAPLHPYPAAVDDMMAFVRFVRTHAASYGILPDAIAALGNSAGGHLASMLGLRDVPEGGVSSRVDAVVNICGISDLTEPAAQHFPISLGFLEQFMGGSYVGMEALWREASPISHVSADAAPFLILHGECDDVVPIAQGEALAAKLFTVGAKVEFHRVPAEGHSFTYAGWTRIERLFLDFLARTLKGEVVA